ncbi:hippocalcin-like protein 4 [Galendromus occidentalis]|uniref:Hippocalcin-like protein 4 n=1 Tax=Galendromus occidentalis TaxID=34638 RepID=A0AAJ6QZ37_9ACAR|nr:hippocalcin-like protein 4 [Galendromus occidentalis]
MGSCMRKIRTPSLSENALVDLIEDTKLNHNVLQGWYKEFITLFPEGVAREEAFVDIGCKILLGGDHSQPEDLMKIIFNFLAETDERVVTFRRLAGFLSISIVGTIEEKIKMAFQLLSNRQDHFDYKSFAAVLDAVRKMRGEISMPCSLQDAFIALSDRKATVDLHRFRDVMKRNPQKIREVASNYDAMRAAPIRVYQ